jgi:hypothetical protein
MLQIIDQMRDYQLLLKDSAAQSYHVSINCV